MQDGQFHIDQEDPKPKFDPKKSFKPADVNGAKPAFNPSQPYEPVKKKELSVPSVDISAKASEIGGAASPATAEEEGQPDGPQTFLGKLKPAVKISSTLRGAFSDAAKQLAFETNPEEQIKEPLGNIGSGWATLKDFEKLHEKSPAKFEELKTYMGIDRVPEEAGGDKFKKDNYIYEVFSDYKDKVAESKVELGERRRASILPFVEQYLPNASKFTGAAYGVPQNLDEAKTIIDQINDKKQQINYGIKNSSAGPAQIAMDMKRAEKEFADADQVLPGLNHLISGFVFEEESKKNPNVTPFELGLKIFEATAPQPYKLYKESGGDKLYRAGGFGQGFEETPRKADAVNRHIVQLGIDAFNSFGDKYTIQKADEESQALGWKFTKPIEEETKHMIAAQLLAQGIKPHKATAEQKDAVAETLPDVNRDVWFERNKEENNVSLPSTGFGFSTSGSYHNTIEDGVKSLIGWMMPGRGRERALDVLEQQSTSSTVGENPESVARLNALRKKEGEGKISAEEMAEKDALEQFTDVRTNWQKFKDLSGQGVGQFAGFGTISAFTGGMSNARTAGGIAKSLISPAADRGGMLAAGYLMSREGNARDAVQMFPGEDQGVKRFVFGEVASANDTYVEILFPEEKFLSGLIKKDVAKLIPNLTVKNIRKELNTGLAERVAKTVVKKVAEQQKTPLQEGIEESVAAKLKDVFHGILDPDREAMAMDDIINVGTQAYLSSQLLGVPKGVMATRNKHVPLNAIWDAASDKKQFFSTKATILEMKEKGDLTPEEANDRISLLNTAQKEWEQSPVLSGNMGNLELPARQNYLARKLNEDVLQQEVKKEEAKEVPDKNVIKELKQQISDSEKARQKIFDGETTVTPRNDEKPVDPLVKKANDQWKANIVAIEENPDLSDEQKELQKTAEDERHAQEVAGITKDAPLLNRIRSSEKVSDKEKGESLQYFVDKTAEAPLAAAERFSKGLTEELLSRVPTETLVKNYQYMAKNLPDSPETAELDRLISEREGGKKEVIAEETVPDITVEEMIDKPGIYKGQRGMFFQDGQTVVFKVEGENKEYELGNVNDLQGVPISEYGISNEETVVGVNDAGDVTVRGEDYKNGYSNPLSAINTDKSGNVVSVNLETADGKKRTFRGNIAEDIAYQIHLKEINKSNETRESFEQHLNEDEGAQKEMEVGGLSEAAAPQSTTGDEKVSREKIGPTYTVDAFVERIAKGERMESPEDLQFYENNATEIEEALKNKRTPSKPQPTEGSKGGEQQKADIERRRQEELKSLDKDISLEQVLKPGNKFTDPAGNNYEIKDVGNERIQVLKNGNQAVIISSSQLKDSVVRNNLDYLRYAAGKKDVTKADIDRINAKYDAELAALEKQTPSKDSVSEEKAVIEKWLNDSDEHSDFVSFDWDGNVLEIFKSRDAAPVEMTRQELEEEGIEFPKPTGTNIDNKKIKDNGKDKESGTQEGASEKNSDQQGSGQQKRSEDKTGKEGAGAASQPAAGSRADNTAGTSAGGNTEFGAAAGSATTTGGPSTKLGGTPATQTGEEEGPPVGNTKPDDVEDGIGITHAQTELIRERYGFGEYDNVDRSTVAEWDRQAAERLKEEGMEPLLEKLRKGEPATPVEQRMMFQIVGYLDKQLSKDPSNDEKFRRYKEAVWLSDRAGGTIAGQSLVARKGRRIPDDTLASFMLQRAEEAGLETLTPGQKIATEIMYNKIQDAKKAFEEYKNQKEKEFEAREAALKIEEFKKAASKKTRTTKDLAAERKEIIDDILLKFATKDDKVSFLGVGKLAEIAPDVLKLARNLVETGAITLKEVVDKIHDALTTGIPDLEKSEINSIIAGKYNEKRETRTELAERWQDLKQEAKLIDELEALNRGEEPTTEKKIGKKNRRLEELRTEIKNHPLTKQSDERKADQEKLERLQNQLARLEAGLEPKIDAKEKREMTDEVKELQKKIKEHDLQILADTKKKMVSQIKQVRDRIDKGDFDKVEKKVVPMDEEGKTLESELAGLKREWQVMLLKERYKKRSDKQKAFDEVGKVLNIPRSIMASMDFSALLNQGLIPTLSHPKMAWQAIKQMKDSMLSQKEFDRWFQEIQDSPRWDLIKDQMKVRLTDPFSPFLEAREEAFGGGYAERIPVLGTHLIKGSERAYVQYLNKMRWDMANRMIDKWEDDGKTYKNSKRLYDFTGKFVNDITGSGNLPFNLEQYAGFFNGLFFSPRLMLSRMRILSQYYLFAAPPEIRKEYAREMGRSLITVGAVLGAFYLKGLTQSDDDPDKFKVELDPRSSDFMKIRQGNTRWNPLGGFQSIMRTGAQAALGSRKSAQTGLISELSADSPFGETPLDVIGKYFRGKLSPVAGTTIDLASGRNIVGEEVTLKSALLRNIIPLTAQTIIEAWNEHGPLGAILKAGVPSAIGIGVQTYEPREKEIKKTIRVTEKVGNKTVSRKVTLTDDQYDDFETKSRDLIKKYSEKLEKIPAYKDADIETQVQIRTMVESAAVRQVQEQIEKKYRHTFEKMKPEEVKEVKEKDETVKKVKKA